jgi:hypothetical protein
MFYNNNDNSNINSHHNIRTYNTTEWRSVWVSHTAYLSKLLDGTEEVFGHQILKFKTT